MSVAKFTTPFLSYFAAGHYVPATAQVIVESNSVFAKNLKGIGIGNGWVDPKLQYAAYSQVCNWEMGWVGPELQYAAYSQVCNWEMGWVGPELQ